jgi:hypothetical protein
VEALLREVAAGSLDANANQLELVSSRAFSVSDPHRSLSLNAGNSDLFSACNAFCRIC